MAKTYVIIIDQSSNLRSEVRSENPDGNCKLAGFYVGYTGKEIDERFAEHCFDKSLIRDHGPKLISIISDLFGDMDQPTARAAEAYVADLIRRQKYFCTSDARLDGVGKLIERAFVVNPQVCQKSWQDSKFTLTSGGLFHGAAPCVTANIEDLRDKLSAISKPFGQYIRNGRFAINEAGQIIRKLTPPHGIAGRFIFAVGLGNGGEVISHTPQIRLESGELIPGVGRAISQSDSVAVLPTVCLEKFKLLESVIIKILNEEIAKYKND